MILNLIGVDHVEKNSNFLCVGAMVLLSACGANSSGSGTTSKPATTETEGKMYERKYGDLFHYYRTNSITNVTSKVAITLSNPEVVKGRGESDTNDSKTDYVKVYVQVENVGDGNSTDMAIRWSNFKTYDSNGKVISTLTWIDKYMEGEFEPVELRPGGKNEGFMYMPIEEGEVPAEIIYFDSALTGAYTNQFVFKL